MKTVKKILLIILIFIVVVVAALFIIPYAFKDKILAIAKEQINEMLVAKVDFEKLNLSLFKNFPNATASIKNISIVGLEEFENDTLLYAKEVNLVFDLSSLFKDDGYDVKKLEFKDPQVLVYIQEDGKANYDIMKEDESPDETEEVVEEDTDGSAFRLKLKDVKISNAGIHYVDKESAMELLADNLNLNLSGDLTADQTLLKTALKIGALSFFMDNDAYISKATLDFKADINADLDKFLFEFKENNTKLNDLAFSFDGWVAMPGEAIDMDLKLNTDGVTFKSILSLVPVMYSDSFSSLKADGNVDLKGYLKGEMTDEDYPSFDFSLKVTNAWFQYPDLPSSVKDINIDARITNPGGSLDATVINIPVFRFDLGGNPFGAEAYIANIMSDPDLRVKATGKLDLGMVKDVYPLEDDMELNGKLNLDLELNGRMSYYDNEEFEKFRFDGRLLVEEMLVKYPALGQDVNLHKADFQFNNQYVNLSDFNINIGKNDISANGRLENFIPFVLKDETLKGELSLNSDYLNLNDFMPDTDGPAEVNEAETVNDQPEEAPAGVIELPGNIDFTLKALFKELIFDKMEFKNTQGNLQLANQQLTFKNLGLEGFGGNLIVNGHYNTQNAAQPDVNMDIDINNVEFTKIFSQVDMLQRFAPVLEKATGTFSSSLNLSSLITKDMSPDLNSLSADGFLRTSSVGLENIPALESLASNLQIGNKLNNLSLKDLLLKFNISNGKLRTEPFNINAGDVKMRIGGETGLDKSINYNGSIDLPESLKLGKLSTVNFKIGGTFSQPKVQLDVKDVITETIDEIKTSVKEEIDNRIDEAKDKVNEEIDKQKEKLVQEARKQAENLKNEAKKQGENLIAEAQKQGENLVEKANGPIAKKAAEATAKKMIEEARKQADNLYRRAEEEGNKLVQEAEKL